MWTVILRVLEKVVAHFVDVKTIIIFRLEGEPNRAITPKVPVEVKRLTRDDMPLISDLYGVKVGSRKEQTFHRRFKDGADCFGAFHRGQLVSVGWGIFGEDVDTSTGFTLKAAADQVISSDGLTSEAFRGMRIRPYMIISTIDFYRQRGLTMITAVEQSNTSSLRNICRIGFKEVHRQHLVKIFGIRVK